MNDTVLRIKTNDDLYKNHTYAYEGDSGLDLYFLEDDIIPAKTTKLIDLKISCEMVEGNPGKVYIMDGKTIYYINKSYYIIPRSSISKTPLRMSNSIGLIDAMYRNTLKVSVDNISDKDYPITRGMKLFQVICSDLRQFKIEIVDELSSSARGEGFGSSDKK